MARTQIRGSQLLDGELTDADIAAANKDGTSGTASLRTLGTGAQQAAAGNDSRLIGAGTSFPGSPAAGQRYFRTDLGWLCFYDGARWLTTHEYAASQRQRYDTVDGTEVICALRTNYAPYITRVALQYLVYATVNGSNYWTIKVRGVGAGYAITDLWSVNTAGATAVTWYWTDSAPSVANPSNRNALDLLIAKTGTPGGIYTCPTVYYRLIVT